jgi:hypothetical protein
MRWRVSFPISITAPREPLIGFRDSGGAVGGVVFVHYVDDAGQLAFGAAVGGKRTPAGDTVSVDLRRVHELVARTWPTSDPAVQRVELRLDGAIVWSHDVRWPTAGVAPVFGRNIAGEPECSASFTGRLHSGQQAPDGGDPLQTAKGDALSLRVRFPADRKGMREPLLVTGRMGAGDLLLVEYVDERTVRFALDHWGGSMLTSDPVPVDFAAPHELRIATSALWGPTSDIPLRMARKGAVRIELDGALVWRTAAPTFASRPAEMAIGVNPIGGTSGSARFSGDILSAERGAR